MYCVGHDHLYSEIKFILKYNYGNYRLLSIEYKKKILYLRNTKPIIFGRNGDVNGQPRCVLPSHEPRTRSSRSMCLVHIIDHI